MRVSLTATILTTISRFSRLSQDPLKDREKWWLRRGLLQKIQMHQDRWSKREANTSQGTANDGDLMQTV